MDTAHTIDRPIFVVGCGRSGTTLLYEVLAGHPHVGWFSNYADRAPQLPALSLITRLHQMGRWPSLLPSLLPSEGYRIWNHCRPVPDPRLDPPLYAHDADAGQVATVRRLVARHLAYQQRPRFINKNTRHSRRMLYLDRIFPDALFVHVMRDPRAATASLMNVAFWPHLPVWSANGSTPLEWEHRGMDPVHLAASLWVAEVGEILKARMTVRRERYMEVRYERLVRDPAGVLQDVLAFAELPTDPAFNRHIQGFHISSRNSKFRSVFNDTQLSVIAEVAGPLARELGYDVNPPVNPRPRGPNTTEHQPHTRSSQ